MAARASWKGFLKLSLVSVPVKAFTSTASSNSISLNQLHKECNSRVKYQKVCPEHGVLNSDDIVSGYQYGKDQYVVIEPDEIDKLRSESDRSINIDSFVKTAKFESIYQSGRTYYLLPDGPVGQKPYFLLLNSMRKKKVGAMAQVVMSGKEQLVLIRPHDGMLTMVMLHHHKDIKSADGFREELENPELTDAEAKLTDTLIDASTDSSFDFSRYEDQYTNKLGELIQMKIDGKQIVQAPNPEEPKIINLMEALKKSVEQAQSAADTKRMAPSAKTKSVKKKPAAKKKSG